MITLQIIKYNQLMKIGHSILSIIPTPKCPLPLKAWANYPLSWSMQYPKLWQFIRRHRHRQHIPGFGLLEAKENCVPLLPCFRAQVFILQPIHQEALSIWVKGKKQVKANGQLMVPVLGWEQHQHLRDQKALVQIWGRRTVSPPQDTGTHSFQWVCPMLTPSNRRVGSGQKPCLNATLLPHAFSSLVNHCLTLLCAAPNTSHIPLCFPKP